MRTAEHRTVVADRYVLQTRLREDRASVTWLANDVVLDRRVCLELIRPEVADDDDVVAAIDSATRALARSSTTVLLSLLDAGAQDGLPFLVTEHVGGETIEDILREHGPLGPDHAIEIGLAVLAGLAEANAVGIVHADVDPSGVRRTVEGIRLRAPGSGQALIRAGRAPSDEGARLPPEVAEGRIDERTDVWCAGALLFELLTGRAPSPAARFVRAERRDVARALDAVIARALAPDPIDRFRDVTEMREALERVARADERADPPGGAGSARRGVFRTWLAVPLLVVVIGIGVVLAGIWVGRLEFGGPVGIRVPDAAPPQSDTSPSVLEVTNVSAYDPFGDGTENSDSVALVTDGDRATVWRSENYFDGELNKDGVGLLLDLADTHDIAAVRLWTPAPGFAFSVRVGDDVGELTDADADPITATDETRVQLDDARGRYVLLWMTSVVPTVDGNRVEVAEVRVLGTVS